MKKALKTPRSIARRIWLMQTGAITALAGCGGGTTDSPSPSPGPASAAAAPAASPNPPSAPPVGSTPVPPPPTAPTAPPANASKVPHRVVIEDHRVASKPVDVGAITIDNALGTDSFAHPVLKQQSSGWSEFGRTGAALVFDGIEFDAWRFSPNADGIYTQADAHRVLVLMRATDLSRSLFGDPRGKRTYAPPFKVRVENAAGAVLAVVQMRDGLPINDPSLPQDPRFANSEASADLAKVMRRHVCAGMALPIYLGATPVTSLATRNYLPRAKVGQLAMPGWAGKSRSAVNGAEMLLLASGNTGSNGNAHPYVMPRWPLSRQSMLGLGANLPTSDPNLVVGNGVRNWESALIYGWDYEPGNYGGVTNRGGPGGIRGDRASVPPEFLQMYLREPDGVRLHDGAKHTDLVFGFVRNTWNYGAYRHSGAARIKPIDSLTFPFTAPLLTTGSNPAPSLVAAYYNRGNATFESSTESPNAVWTLDSYSESDGSQWADGVNPLDNRHPTAGWNPDSEHSNRLTGCFAAWIYADPLYSRMQEFLMSENAMEYPAIHEGIGADSYIPFGLAYAADSEFPGFSRSNVLRFSNLLGAWASASEKGNFTRAKCESRIRAMALHITRQYRDLMPADDNTVDRLAWHRYATNIVFDDTFGWCMNFPIYTQYVAEFLLMARAFGLTQVLLNEGTTTEKQACKYLIDQWTLHISQVEQWMVRCPWKVGATGSGSLLLPMRSPAQGAVNGNVSSVPVSWDAIEANAGANPRSDGVWHVGANDLRNSSANYVREMSLKIAYISAEYMRPTSDPLRATHLATLNARLLSIDAYAKRRTTNPRELNGLGNFNTLLHAWPQDVPALG
jgi:hypothetical protein